MHKAAVEPAGQEGLLPHMLEHYFSMYKLDFDAQVAHDKTSLIISSRYWGAQRTHEGWLSCMCEALGVQACSRRQVGAP